MNSVLIKSCFSRNPIYVLSYSRALEEVFSDHISFPCQLDSNLDSEQICLCRALAASHIAQQAAASKAEKVLKEAVERAENAVTKAEEAEQQAAEAAAHASAHQDVASSQADTSSKVQYTLRKHTGFVPSRYLFIFYSLEAHCP